MALLGATNVGEAMSDERPPNPWYRCATCDIRFRRRSAESLKHDASRDCIVLLDEGPKEASGGYDFWSRVLDRDDELGLS